MLSIVWVICFKNCWDFEQLLAQAKAINNLAVPIRVTAIEIVQQTPAFIDHHDQPAAGCMVFHVRLEMRRQVVDPLAEKRDLHFRRSSSLSVTPEFVLLSSTHSA